MDEINVNEYVLRCLFDCKYFQNVSFVHFFYLRTEMLLFQDCLIR